MRLIFLRVLLCIVLCLLFVGRSGALDPDRADWKLRFLLNDETSPFFPDTTRHIFINAAMQKASTSCKYAATYVDTIAWVPASGTNSSVSGITIMGGNHVWEILGLKAKDTDYGLMRVNKQDIGLDKITTDEQVRYWYLTGWGQYVPAIGVYDAASDSTPLEVYLCTVADWDSSRALRHCYENEVVLYALYLSYLRRGELEIAAVIRQIALNELIDLKMILEGQPADITIERELMDR